MDQEGVTLEPEIVEILDHIAHDRHFLLHGGAGSGKTYSLVRLVGELLRTRLSARIVCIAYTNAAIHEIESRVMDDRLTVCTIHNFLWSNIKPFQRALKTVLIEAMSGQSPRIDPGLTRVSADMYDGKTITYKDFKGLAEGVISHNEVILLAHALFAKYPKMRRVLHDRYDFILVDEYQDTMPDVIDILLKFAPPRKADRSYDGQGEAENARQRCLCGFFGDDMQAIYDNGVGSLRTYLKDYPTIKVSEVVKQENRRNPRLVIELANKLRRDGLKQRASNDLNAPNRVNGQLKEGKIGFYYARGCHPDDKAKAIERLRVHLGWNFGNGKEVKELNLTHRLNARQGAFGELLDIYNADGVIAYRDTLVCYLESQGCLAGCDEMTFGEVIDKYGSKCPPKSASNKFIATHQALFDEAKKYHFRDFRRMRIHKSQLMDDNKAEEPGASQSHGQQCPFIRHVFRILHFVELYQARQFNALLRKIDRSVHKAGDKKVLAQAIETIGGMGERPASEVIDYAFEHGLTRKDEDLAALQERNPYLYNRVSAVKLSVFAAARDYIDGNTTYSTQHKVKGREFENVLVLLDNGLWSHYNFEKLFTKGAKESVQMRTEKLFYVCCTRSKEALAVYFHEPSDRVLEKAREWFGAEHVTAI